MPPSHVKPYVKRNKTDAADAEAICEAVTRPSMRFVPVKSEADSAALVLHRARDFLVGQVTQVGNAIRAHMAEFGIVTAKGSKRAAWQKNWTKCLGPRTSCSRRCSINWRRRKRRSTG